MDYVDQLWELCTQYIAWYDETNDPCDKEQALAIAKDLMEEIDLMAVSCMEAKEVRIHRLEDL